MKRATWLARLRNSVSQHRRRNAATPHAAEHLEERTYLSVASILIGSELRVISDASEAITIQNHSNGSGAVEILIDGASYASTPSIRTDQISRIHVIGGSGDNRIDLSSITAADFSFVHPVTGSRMEILVEGGDGDDTLLGSFDLNDTLIGGDGDDTINTAPQLVPSTPISTASSPSNLTSAFISPLAIVNGSPTTFFSSVGLVGDSSGNFASGTLISPTHVLTAAHSVQTLASTDARFTIAGQTFSSSQIYVHPNFQSSQLGTDQANDLAIIELSQAVTGVAPSTILRSAPLAGSVVTIVGFGEGGNSTGPNGMGGTLNVGLTPIDTVTPTLIQSDFDDPNEATFAPGDDGGPAFLQVNGQFFITAVQSGTTLGTSALGDTAFSTRVDVYAPWIDFILATPGISNRRGNFVIDGGDGDDTLFGGDGNDSVRGGDGNDSITTGAGNDSVNGGDGADMISTDDGDDVVHGGQGDDSIRGGNGMDTLEGDIGNDTLQGDAGNDSLLGGLGDDLISGADGDDIIDGNAGDDLLIGGAGLDQINGGIGNDSIDVGDQFITVDDIVVQTEGNTGVSTATFTISLSRASVIPITVDIATLDGGATAGTDYVANSATLTFAPGQIRRQFNVDIIGDIFAEFDESFFVRLSNPTNAVIVDDLGQATILDDGDGPTQLVFLDFDSGTDFTEHFYTQQERDQVQQRLEADYGPFSFVFTQVRPLMGPFTTIRFNDVLPIPGLIGIAQDGIDFRNLNQSDTVILDASVAINFLNVPPTAANFIAVSANVAAHELGHSVGLRHGDAFGPIGNGVPANLAPFFLPSYPGPTNPSETNRHVMATPAFGQPLTALLGDVFFGARESIKLAMFSFEGQVLQENFLLHDSIANAQPITLRELPVPNLEQTGPFVGLEFDVNATAVTGSINSPGELDYYSFTGQAGDLLNFEVISQILAGTNPPRFLDPIDTTITIFDSSGAVVPYYTTFAMNDDEWEGSTDSILIDLILPADDTYFIEVGTFSGADVGQYELFAYTFDAVTPFVPASNAGTPTTAPDTLTGGDGNDIIAAGDGDDIIIGGSDNDSISAAGGNDLVNGGSGRDTIRGGDGNDTLLGHGGLDSIEGNNGDDLINGGGSRDILFGDDALQREIGNDTISGGSANDTIDGGNGDDVLLGGGGDDILRGSSGNDTLSGQSGRDTLVGGTGNDIFIWRGDGGDQIDGQDGLDELSVRGSSSSDLVTLGQSQSNLTVNYDGSTISVTNDVLTLGNSVERVVVDVFGGNDRVVIGDIDRTGAYELIIAGGSGNDVINADLARIGNVRLLMDGGIGFDTITGSAGNDTILGGDGDDSLRGGAGDDTILGGDGSDEIRGGAGRDLLDGEERNDSLFGGDDIDTLVGGRGNDSLEGEGGDDILSGGIGHDTLNGGDGNDSALGESGNDSLSGGLGADTLDGGSSEDTITGDAGDDVMRGEDGDDSLDGGDGNDTIAGGHGNDTILGSAGDDLIDGGDGNDLINGNAGQDTILGSDGDDSLIGGSGDDIIIGGLGNDGLSGNGGTDTLDGGEGIDLFSNTSALDAVFDSDKSFKLSAAILAALNANV